MVNESKASTENKIELCQASCRAESLILSRHKFVMDVAGTFSVVQRSPFIIGVAGGTASGKTSVCEKIMHKLGDVYKRHVAMISQDAFYRDLTDAEKSSAYKGEFNFDHPDAFDLQLMSSTLQQLRTGHEIKLPVYDFRNHCRQPHETKNVDPADVILVEGILVFYDPVIRELFNMKLFVDCDPDTRLARRVLRDTRDRGRDLQNVLHQYLDLVKPAFEEFCQPTKKYADVIIPRGADNDIAIDLIVQHIQELLRTPRQTPSLADGIDLVNGANGRARHNSDSYMMFSHTFRPH